MSADVRRSDVSFFFFFSSAICVVIFVFQGEGVRGGVDTAPAVFVTGRTLPFPGTEMGKRVTLAKQSCVWWWRWDKPSLRPQHAVSTHWLL